MEYRHGIGQFMEGTVMDKAQPGPGNPACDSSGLVTVGHKSNSRTQDND